MTLTYAEAGALAAVDGVYGCPCCGDGMSGELVVCWPCYRGSCRLTPGVYVDALNPGGWTLTAADVARFDRLRAVRLGWAS